MPPYHRFGLALSAAIAVLLTSALLSSGCLRYGRGAASRVLQMTMDDCIELAHDYNDPEMEQICRTAKDLAPVLDLFLARHGAARKGADGGAQMGTCSEGARPDGGI